MTRSMNKTLPYALLCVPMFCAIGSQNNVEELNRILTTQVLPTGEMVSDKTKNLINAFVSAQIMNGPFPSDDILSDTLEKSESWSMGSGKVKSIVACYRYIVGTDATLEVPIDLVINSGAINSLASWGLPFRDEHMVTDVTKASADLMWKFYEYSLPLYSISTADDYAKFLLVAPIARWIRQVGSQGNLTDKEWNRLTLLYIIQEADQYRQLTESEFVESEYDELIERYGDFTIGASNVRMAGLHDIIKLCRKRPAINVAIRDAVTAVSGRMLDTSKRDLLELKPESSGRYHKLCKEILRLGRKTSSASLQSAQDKAVGNLAGAGPSGLTKEEMHQLGEAVLTLASNYRLLEVTNRYPESALNIFGGVNDRALLPLEAEALVEGGSIPEPMKELYLLAYSLGHLAQPWGDAIALDYDAIADGLLSAVQVIRNLPVDPDAEYKR